MNKTDAEKFCDLLDSFSTQFDVLLEKVSKRLGQIDEHIRMGRMIAAGDLLQRMRTGLGEYSADIKAAVEKTKIRMNRKVDDVESGGVQEQASQ